MKKLLGFTFLLFCLISCLNENEKYTRFLNKTLQEYYPEQSQKYSYIMIMPRQGCKSCINESEDFFREHKDDLSYLFIFTRIESRKTLGLEIGNESLNSSNVLIDTENNFHNSAFSDDNYPIILIKQKNGSFVYKKL